MRISQNLLTAVLAACVLATSPMAPASAAKKKEFNIAWTIYVGWMPWPYAAESGIVKKWADKYGITINVVQINDYVESINQYTAGKFDGVTVTNMDALTIPAAGGRNRQCIHVGDGHAVEFARRVLVDRFDVVVDLDHVDGDAVFVRPFLDDAGFRRIGPRHPADIDGPGDVEFLLLGSGRRRHRRCC